MRRALAGLAIFVLTILAYGLYLGHEVGQFRRMADLHPGRCRIVGGIRGPEDITFDPVVGVARISSFDRRGALSGRSPSGAIFRYRPGPASAPVDATPDAGPELRPHGISLHVDERGRRTLFVVNHPGGSPSGNPPNWPGGSPPHAIEVFDVVGQQLVHRATRTHGSMTSPNDVVGVGHRQFYFINDYGSGPRLSRALEDTLRLAWANVVYFDGERFRTVADGLSYANGINVSPDGAQIYVAESTRGRIREFARDPETGARAHRRAIDVPFGVDTCQVTPTFTSLGDTYIYDPPGLMFAVPSPVFPRRGAGGGAPGAPRSYLSALSRSRSR